MELVVAKQGDCFGGAGLHGLVALVIDDGERTVGRHRVQLLGDQDVEVLVSGA